MSSLRVARALLLLLLCGVGEYVVCRLAIALTRPAGQVLRGAGPADVQAAGELVTGSAAVLFALAWSWLTGAAILTVTDVARGEQPRRRLAAPARLNGAIAALLGTSALCLPVAAGASSPDNDANGSRSRPTAAAVDGLPLPDRPRGTGQRPPVWPTGYRVVDGDSLWGLTRLHLDPRSSDARVARAWPRWYAANEDVIGPDPDMLMPGTVLQPPGPGAGGPRCSAKRTTPAGDEPATFHGGRP